MFFKRVSGRTKMTAGYLDGLKFHKQMNTCLALLERLRLACLSTLVRAPVPKLRRRHADKEGEEFALKLFTHH